jgi:hypothetical protein
VGIEYDKSLFGIKLADCRQLARALERTETLTYLDLSSNNMDDDKVRMVASGLVDNVSVTHLNFSHNKVHHTTLATWGHRRNWYCTVHMYTCMYIGNTCLKSKGAATGAM